MHFPLAMFRRHNNMLVTCFIYMLLQVTHCGVCHLTFIEKVVDVLLNRSGVKSRWVLSLAGAEANCPSLTQNLELPRAQFPTWKDMPLSSRSEQNIIILPQDGDIHKNNLSSTLSLSANVWVVCMTSNDSDSLSKILFS